MKPTADRSVLADYNLFLLSLEEQYPGIRATMKDMAKIEPEMDTLLSDLNTQYQQFCWARTREDIIAMQLTAANTLSVLQKLLKLGVVPSLKTKASRMSGVQFSEFTLGETHV
jgi:hypothetical protein